MGRFGWIFVTSAFVLLAQAPHPVIARARGAGTTTSPATYAQFTLSERDLARMQAATERACIRHGLPPENDFQGLLGCYQVMTNRLTLRMRRAIAQTTPDGEPSARQRKFYPDQRIWAETHVRNCEVEVEEIMRPNGYEYAAAIKECVVRETYRRTLWIERYRR